MPWAATLYSLPLVCWGMLQELLLHVRLAQLLVHCHQQLLGLGIHIPHVHTPLVVEEHKVSLPGSVDADIELLLLHTIRAKVSSWHPEETLRGGFWVGPRGGHQSTALRPIPVGLQSAASHGALTCLWGTKGSIRKFFRTPLALAICEQRSRH